MAKMKKMFRFIQDLLRLCELFHHESLLQEFGRPQLA